MWNLLKATSIAEAICNGLAIYYELQVAMGLAPIVPGTSFLHLPYEPEDMFDLPNYEQGI